MRIVSLYPLPMKGLRTRSCPHFFMPDRLIYSASEAVKTCQMDLYYEPMDQIIRRMGRRKA